MVLVEENFVQDCLGQILPLPAGALVATIEALVRRLIPVTGNRLFYLGELEDWTTPDATVVSIGIEDYRHSTGKVKAVQE